MNLPSFTSRRALDALASIDTTEAREVVLDIAQDRVRTLRIAATAGLAAGMILVFNAPAVATADTGTVTQRPAYVHDPLLSTAGFLGDADGAASAGRTAP
jgi:hypothetical protein